MPLPLLGVSGIYCYSICGKLTVIKTLCVTWSQAVCDQTSSRDVRIGCDDECVYGEWEATTTAHMMVRVTWSALLKHGHVTMFQSRYAYRTPSMNVETLLRQQRGMCRSSNRIPSTQCLIRRPAVCRMCTTLRRASVRRPTSHGGQFR